MPFLLLSLLSFILLLSVPMISYLVKYNMNKPTLSKMRDNFFLGIVSELSYYGKLLVTSVMVIWFYVIYQFLPSTLLGFVILVINLQLLLLLLLNLSMTNFPHKTWTQNFFKFYSPKIMWKKTVSDPQYIKSNITKQFVTKFFQNWHTCLSC